MIKFLAVLAILVTGLGCATGIKDIDVSHADPTCVRECSMAYSQCAAGGPSVGLKTETLHACRESYEVCINTCKAK